jgi:hypothetical protein
MFLRTNRNQLNQARLGLEQLEDRQMLSASPLNTAVLTRPVVAQPPAALVSKLTEAQVLVLTTPAAGQTDEPASVLPSQLPQSSDRMPTLVEHLRGRDHPRESGWGRGGNLPHDSGWGRGGRGRNHPHESGHPHHRPHTGSGGPSQDNGGNQTGPTLGEYQLWLQDGVVV